jgi:DegV family protein with EDD domain
LAVKIVTDSGSDIPLKVVKELDIAVVPVYIYFGDKVYKDGVDISPDELYKRLVEGPIYPTTTQPMPADFAGTYRTLSEGADAIVSIHLPARVSGTYNAALQGVEIARPRCEVHVVDSFLVSGGLGLIAIAAARVAKAGGTLAEVLEETNKAISRTQLRGLLDTLHYLLKGGRITKAKALVGTLLNVKPILTMRRGEIVQAGMARSYAKGIERLFEFVKGYPNLQEVAIAHSTVPEEAEALRKRIAFIIDEERIHISRVGAGLGVHCGPGTIIVAARGG